MSRPVRVAGPRVTYHRNFLPSGRPAGGELMDVMMNRAGSYLRRNCAVCGNEIGATIEHYVDRNGSVDRVHKGCAEAVVEVTAEALARGGAR